MASEGGPASSHVFKLEGARSPQPARCAGRPDTEAIFPPPRYGQENRPSAGTEPGGWANSARGSCGVSQRSARRPARPAQDSADQSGDRLEVPQTGCGAQPYFSMT